MMKLIIASQNPGKIAEIKTLLGDLPIEVIVPNRDVEVEETGTTFAENALIKAKAYQAEFRDDFILADDSGLIVDALDGRPGVYSKRYGSNDTQRMQKMLSDLAQVPAENRSARFVATMAVIGPNVEQVFEGKVEGKIASEMRGGQGFGYDPIFIPDGYEETFGELGESVKNSLSHRAKALSQVISFLAQIEKSRKQ
jgi:XTP/dITP diphosphohydrolase